jgi:hypothetical protein
MKINEFEVKLKESNLNKKSFSDLTGIPYPTILGWNNLKKTPVWVETWLNNYIKAKSYDDVKNKVLDLFGGNHIQKLVSA